MERSRFCVEAVVPSATGRPPRAGGSQKEEQGSMPKTLVVVESPAKAKTIERYLGPDYVVRASYGHIRDLPKSKLGVDPEHDFQVEYEVPERSKEHVAVLKRAMKSADGLVLATDFDRE